MLEILRRKAEQGVLRFVDLYFAEHLAKLSQRHDPDFLLAATLTSFRAGMGDVCLDLASIAEANLCEVWDDFDFDLRLPPLQTWREVLQSISVVGKPGEIAPLILDEANRLYLGRYWWYEKQVADSLKARAAASRPESFDQHQLQQRLARLFPATVDAVDWQKVAAALAALGDFLVISGGPGTGKTHTVATILALLLEQNQGKPFRVALAAPTGKAAARLSESIQQLKSRIASSAEVLAAIPDQATTIHRLLGVRPNQALPGHHAGNPLHLDLLVLDEASMIDLPMMARVLAALPAQAKLLLLGDKHQLSSVEAGSLFADICGGAQTSMYSAALRLELEAVTACSLPSAAAKDSRYDHILLLQKSYRFQDDAGIGQLASAVKAGKDSVAMDILRNPRAGLRLASPLEGELARKIRADVAPFFAGCLASKTAAQALQAFAQARVLCATREGSCGVRQVNAMVEAALLANGTLTQVGDRFPGRPIMITQNDYNVGLFNGDIGVLWPAEGAGGPLRAWFAAADGELKSLLPSRLPPHETAFAMTVHKSQGSEFQRVWLLLPFVDCAVLSREWVYTGITRAKEQVDIWSSELILRGAITREIRRTSGLSDQLYASVDE